MKTRIVFLVLVIAFTNYVCGQSIIAPGAQVEKLAGEFKFTEGPASDLDGNVYFTDQPNNRIMIWSVDDQLSTFMQPSGRSNGLTFDKDGFLWSCADEKNQLWKISPEKEVEIIIKNYEGSLLNGPNDLWIRPDGGIYFSDPYYQRNWWKHTEMPQECQCVYYLSPDRNELKRVAIDLLQPNGIIGTPNGKKLYVTDIKDKKTYSYKIKKDGSLSGKKLLCEMGSDGMTLDDQGNVYLTNKGVFVFDEKGTQIEHIEIPEGWTANVCFGGSDMKSLFITASKGLYRMKMNVSGVGSQ